MPRSRSGALAAASLVLLLAGCAKSTTTAPVAEDPYEAAIGPFGLVPLPPGVPTPRGRGPS
ncbi:MAG: hypothetical protein A2W00_03125 [Candidatus Eisenbacteria bacterium RBG_16_71_46]|nr:MAG: hypothetical protein A2W00_03125 [Candidatus Eisenbacteria bacterium RBG_16_71_46]